MFGIRQIEAKSFLFELASIIIKGFFILSAIILFLFVLLTASKLKFRDAGVIDEVFPVGEKFRSFLFDEGIDMTFIGMIYGAAFYLADRLIYIFNPSAKVFTSLGVSLIAGILLILFGFIIHKIMKD